MADIQITDEASLEAWLKTRPRRDAEIIAFRAAARVFPLWGRAMEEDWAGKNGLSALAFVRPLLSAAHLEHPKVAMHRDVTSIVSDHFSTRASFWAISAAYALVGARPFSPLMEIGFDPSAFSVPTGDRPFRFHVVQVMVSAENAVNGIQLSRDGTWLHDGSFDGSGSPTKLKLARWLREFYEQIDADCKRLAAASRHDFDLFGSAPLWFGAEADWFKLPNNRTRAIWAKDPPTWAFWEKWWDGVISGDMPFAEGLLRDVALIEDDIWQAGPKAVAAAIDKLISARALAMTDNGESVEINPETGKLRLVGADTLPPDIDRYARRKMAKALALFEGELSNQYRPLDAPMRTIRAALGDIENLPVELFDACASASRMTAILVETQSIPAPEQDPLIGEFVASLRETAADILAADTKAQDILTKRKAVMGNDSLIANAGDINIVVGQIVVVAEGALQRLLPENAAAALNPNAHPEERRDGAYKLIGRILRIAGWTIAAPIGALGAVGAAIDGYYAIMALVSSPQFQAVLAWCLKYISLG